LVCDIERSNSKIKNESIEIHPPIHHHLASPISLIVSILK
jgi:hypothetical protein